MTASCAGLISHRGQSGTGPVDRFGRTPHVGGGYLSLARMTIRLGERRADEHVATWANQAALKTEPLY